MSLTTDLEMAYHMGYDDALARRKPDASKVHVFGRGTCKADKLCDGYLYYTSYWCRGCDERFAYRPIGDKDRGASPKFCPNCGRKVVDE